MRKRRVSARRRQEIAFVEATAAGKTICTVCDCTLSEYADKCKAGLLYRCPGYEFIERARDEFSALHPIVKQFFGVMGAVKEGLSADAARNWRMR